MQTQVLAALAGGLLVLITTVINSLLQWRREGRLLLMQTRQKIYGSLCVTYHQNRARGGSRFSNVSNPNASWCDNVCEGLSEIDWAIDETIFYAGRRLSAELIHLQWAVEHCRRSILMERKKPRAKTKKRIKAQSTYRWGLFSNLDDRWERTLKLMRREVGIRGPRAGGIT